MTCVLNISPPTCHLLRVVMEIIISREGGKILIWPSCDLTWPESIWVVEKGLHLTSIDQSTYPIRLNWIWLTQRSAARLNPADAFSFLFRDECYLMGIDFFLLLHNASLMRIIRSSYYGFINVGFWPLPINVALAFVALPYVPWLDISSFFFSSPNLYLDQGCCLPRHCLLLVFILLWSHASAPLEHILVTRLSQ